jgi:acyl dehydratase
MPNPIRQKAIAGLKKGDSFRYARTFTREDIQHFGDLTRDYNPVHYDVGWATAKGFRGLICHGLIVGAMICEFGGQVGWLATGMRFTFVKPVYVGDTVTCCITITAIEASGRAEAEACFTNQAKDTVGYARLTGRLPRTRERDRLRRMVQEGDPTNKLSETVY